MQNRVLIAVVLFLGSASLVPNAAGQASRSYERLRTGGEPARRVWMNEDLRLTSGSLLSHSVSPGGHLLVGLQGFSMTLAGRKLSGDRAVVWIETTAGREGAIRYRVRVYLAGDLSGLRGGGGPETGLLVTELPGDRAAVVQVQIGGELYVTAGGRETKDPRALPLYREAVEVFREAGLEVPPELEPTPAPTSGVRRPPSRAEGPEPDRPDVGYAISFAPLTDDPLKVERTETEQGEDIVTVIGRSYLSWRQTGPDREGELQELQADTLVAWLATEADEQLDRVNAGELRGVRRVYVAGDVLLRQGERTIRADELYYDLVANQALASDVVLRTYDETRNIPIYLRAAELRQVSANEFTAEDVILTTSEFYTPQLSLEAARIRVTDETGTAGQPVEPSDSAFEAELEEVAFRYGGLTILKLPTVKADRERPDLPIRSVRMGHDRTYGTSVETRWFLSRLLGLQEPEGTEATLNLDYYGKRGLGGGAEIGYERDTYFGSFLGYIIDDEGQDRLSRTRRNVAVPDETRGRVRLQHRHFLPYGWQLTAEASYLSDRNFLEQFYRSEFNVGKEQETLLYLKRIEDNWGLSLLGKTRVNDFLDKVEELPSAEYHLTGQSLFDHRFTFFSNTQVSRYRYRFSPENPLEEPDDYFAFAGTRNELDLPLTVGRSKVVPFVAGTFGYDDGGGFAARLDDEPVEDEDAIVVGEAGVRVGLQPFWAVYPDTESRLWDLHGIRHIIRPSLVAVTYAENEAVAEQRDTVDLEIAQRWQTKRGPVGRRRTVDWLELDLDFVWVGDSREEPVGPDRFIWSRPFIPLSNAFGGTVPPLDRRTADLFGPRQHYTSAEVIWRLTDTTSILGDAYFDMQNGALEQFDAGVSRLVWPNLSYYLGNRYLRHVETPLGIRSSNFLTFAATYVLDPRYTVVLAEQYDFDYGANVRTDLTLIRKYHRMNLALTFSADGTLDEEKVVLSLWPEGVPELAIGLRRYMGLGVSDVYY